MGPFYLIYHPERERKAFDHLTVYHDKFGGNEDPYLWNPVFLHTYCHITQLPNDKGQVNFWVSADSYTNPTELYCDCVFYIEEKIFWTKSDHISMNDPLVDNLQSYHHHYKWANENKNHRLARRRRYTLKGHRTKSFQPQNSCRMLIDILPFLNKEGIDTSILFRGLKAKVGSKPFKLTDGLGQKLYEYLWKTAAIKLTGSQLSNLHPNTNFESEAEACNNCC